MKISLDYARRSAFPMPLRWALLAAAVLLLAWQGWQAHRLQARLHGLEWQLAERQRTSAGRSLATPAYQASLKLRLQQANQLLQELGMPWNALFRQLEESATPDIALLEIAPEATKGHLALSGQASSVPALLAYVRALETLPALTDVSIQQHEMLADVPRLPVSFRLQARWEVRS